MPEPIWEKTLKCSAVGEFTVENIGSPPFALPHVPADIDIQIWFHYFIFFFSALSYFKSMQTVQTKIHVDQVSCERLSGLRVRLSHQKRRVKPETLEKRSAKTRFCYEVSKRKMMTKHMANEGRSPKT